VQGVKKEPEVTKVKLGEWRRDKSALIKIDISAKENRIKDGAVPAGLQYGLKGYNSYRFKN
jgi:hypothetical protein